MILKTVRLELFPLSWKELEYLTTNVPLFEKSVSYLYDGDELTDELLSIFSNQIHKIKSNPKQMEYHTFWMIVLKKTNTIIGSICYKGPLDENLSLEIGYGLGFRNRRHGYMTEAVQAMTSYAFNYLGAVVVRAQTLKTNIASQRTLEKNHFVIKKRTNKYYYYECLKP